MKPAAEILVCADCGQLQTRSIFCVRCGGVHLAPVGDELPFFDPEKPKEADRNETQGGNGGRNAPDYFKGL